MVVEDLTALMVLWREAVELFRFLFFINFFNFNSGIVPNFKIQTVQVTFGFLSPNPALNSKPN